MRKKLIWCKHGSIGREGGIPCEYRRRGLLDGGGTGAVLLGSESTSETGEQGRLKGGGATPGESSSVTCSKEGIA